MATSDRTKVLKKKRFLFFILSYGVWVATALFFTIFAFATLGKEQTMAQRIFGIFSADAQKWLVALGSTTIIALIGTIIVKDKMMTFVWMVTLVLAVMLFGKAGMFIVLIIWGIDDYVLLPMFKHYCHLVQINKEIDLR